MPSTPEPLPPFPPEAGWLEATPPEVGPDFVARTLARLRDHGLLARPATAAAEPADPDLERLVARYRPPAPDPRFVERTLAAIQQQRADHWRRLLLRYEAPVPTPDFVDRTLRALQPATAGARSPWPRRLLPLLAVAAAAMLMFVLRADRPAFALRALVATTDMHSAHATSPLVLSHLLALAEADTPPLPFDATALRALAGGAPR